jgi:hypothetical protein
MWTDRLAGIVAVLGLLVFPTGVFAQIRPEPRPLPRSYAGDVHSLFGERSFGFPVRPKERDFGGGGMFGPRPNLGRGFSPRPSFSIWEGFPGYNPEAGAGNDRLIKPAAELATPWKTETAPVGGAQRPVVPFRQTAQAPEQAVQPLAQPGQPAGAPAAQPAQPEMWFREPGPAAGQPGAAGMPLGGAGAAAPGRATANPGGRPTYAWNAAAIGGVTRAPILAEQLERVLRNGLRSPMEVTVQNETATLRGKVATEHDRLLAEHIARFEPGVRFVKNELTVAKPAPQPAR